jgi:Uroporphyrinogen decarboxylase (URO-D)
MIAQLTSRQRLLNAFNHQPVDHVPLFLRFWSLGNEGDHIPFNWCDEFERVEHTLALGLDDTLTLQPPLGYVEDYCVEAVPGVISQVEWLPTDLSDGYPLLKKTYSTPAGPLQTIIKVTDDWPRGKDIHLFDDYNLSRLKEPLIKDCADLPRLKFLLADPDPHQVSSFRQQAAAYRAAASRLGVLLEGGWTALGDALMWLLGIEPVLYLQMDNPGLLEDLLDILLEWELKRVDYLLAEGIEVLVHMAWYESTDFWTPKNWRRMLKPRLIQLIQKAHQCGIKFRYIITKSWKPLRQDLVELSIDCLTGVDPVQDQLDLCEVKQQIGDQVCLMGGLNSAVMLSQWNQDQIRWAIDQALQILAPGGGFILYPVDAIFSNQSWEKVTYLIKYWKETQSRNK